MNLKFPLGENKDGLPALSTVELAIYTESGKIKISIEQERQDIIDPIGGYGTDFSSVLLCLTKEEALSLCRQITEAVAKLECSS
jgi:hypothetical protein